MIPKREIESAVIQYVLSLSEEQRFNNWFRCEQYWCGAELARAVGAHRNGHFYAVLDEMCRKGLLKFAPARYPLLDHFGTIYIPDYEKCRKEVE